MRVSLVSIVVMGSLIHRVTPVAGPCTPPPQPPIVYIPPAASPEAAVHRVFNESNYGFENLAVRANGQILATAAFGPSAAIWQIDPDSIHPPIVLKQFPTLTSTLGITELAPDVFYFAAANESDSSSGSIYSINMRSAVTLPNGSLFPPPIVQKVASIPSAGLNGVTHIRSTDDFVLVADSLLGGVWKANVVTGVSSLILQDPTMSGPPNTTSFAAFGINGVRVQNSTLFYTNSGAETLHKMLLHADGSSAGPAQLVASELSCDDLVLDRWGIPYVASPSRALIRIDPQTGAQLVVAGTFNSSMSDLVGPTSVQFGRRASDATSVYVTTNGASFACAPPGSQGVSRVDIGDQAQV